MMKQIYEKNNFQNSMIAFVKLNYNLKYEFKTVIMFGWIYQIHPEIKPSERLQQNYPVQDQPENNMATKSVHRTLLPRAARVNSSQQHNNHDYDEDYKQKERISEQLKQKYIQDLQERNRKLKNEIKRISEVLEQNQEKEQQKIKDRQKNMGKNHKSLVSRNSQQNNPQLLKRELQNVYKQVKNYEREIQKVQNYRVGSKNSSDQLSRLETIRHEKVQHMQKLNNELSALSSLQAANQKKLKNNMSREHYENQIVKVGEQMKVMRQQLRGMEEKEKRKIANGKKQLQFIKKLQGELLEGGIAMDEIEELKRKNVYIQIKNIMAKQKDQDKPNTPPDHSNSYTTHIDQETVTFEKLDEMKNQIKLYKKLHQDYQKKLISIQKEKETADKLITQKKILIEQKNTEIDNLGKEIEQIKQIVRKSSQVNNETLVANQDSIRKLQRKKSIGPSQSLSKQKEGKKISKRDSQKRNKQ